MSHLKTILEKYCDFTNPEKTGLFLLDLPTGFGKTHNVFDYIHDVYQQNPTKKILFITNLKKNLEPEKLRDRFSDKTIFDKHVIFIDSNVDYVLKKFTTIKELIPNEFQEAAEFKRLEEEINSYKNFENSTDDFKIKWREKIKEDIRLIHEPMFRTHIQTAIYRKHRTKDARRKAVKNDKQFNWLPKLYPTVLSHEKQIFFLSVDKFLVRNTPIIDYSYHFTDHNFLDNALIFIDEFDASKDIFLKRIIENQLQRKVDLIGLFTQIFMSLNTLKLPKDFQRNSAKRDDNTKHLRELITALKAKTSPSQKDVSDLQKLQKQLRYLPDIRQVIGDVKDKINEIDKQYEITYFIKTRDLEQKKNFLFHDYRYNTIIGEEGNFIYLRKDEKDNIRYIEFDEHKKEFKDRPNIIEYIGIVSKFINFFKKQAVVIAENYQEIKEEETQQTEEGFIFENGLRTFFNALNIDSNFQKYLLDTTEHRSFKKQERKFDFKDVSFYSKGFRYFDFEDSDQHDLQSKIFTFAFNTTPEKILLDLAKNNLVVGISATAKNKSVIGNFDLDYLAKKLKENFIEIDENEKDILRQEFKEKVKNYDKLNINAKLIKASDDIDLELESLIQDEDTRNQIYTELEPLDVFFQKRYIRIGKVFEQFIKQDDIKSMLCFLNALPSNKSDYLNINIIELFFDAIIKKYSKQSLFSQGNKYSVKNSYYILGSKGFDLKIQAIKSKLSKGEKLFILSTYQTVGAGQNIQYPIPDKLEIIKIFERKNSNTKDFDAIYLDQPTNLLVNIKGKKIDDFNLAKRIFHLEMLFADQDIFYSHLIYEVKKTFQKAFNEKYNIFFPNESYSNLYKSKNYFNFAAKQIIQAVGRINRTNNKNRNVYIFADYNIAETLNNFDTTDTILLKEFEALIKECNYELSIHPKKAQSKEKQQIDFTNFHSYNFIRDKINAKWVFKEDIEDWKELREFVLKNPTLSKETFSETDWDFIYLFLPKVNNHYYYKQENDFSSVTVNFNNHIGSEVSENEVRLSQLMQIDLIRNFFEAQSYATYFKPDDYIFAPIIFNNIYKGALGEIIGKLILEESLSIKLEELKNEHFEKFDFVFNQNYIDFKFWNDEVSIISKENLHKHIRNKIKQTGADKAFIINILASNQYKIQTTPDGKIIEIPYLIDKQTFDIDLEIIQQLKNLLL